MSNLIIFLKFWTVRRMLCRFFTNIHESIFLISSRFLHYYEKISQISYMTEDIMASVEQSRELIVRVHEIFEAIFPQSHVFEIAERFLITFDPVR